MEATRPRPPTSPAAWTKLRPLGRGSSATVSLASSPSSSSPLFAVKSAELSRSAPLRREQRILSALDSPGVVSYLGFDEGNGFYSLFVEFAPGGSLSDEIKRSAGRLDECSIKVLAADMLFGLVYLHANGVVHCDIKAENVLIGGDGRAKIADFGCAKTQVEQLAGVRGSPVFMAPEVARGEEQGPPADIWALGCTVIEMATGRPPWPDVSSPMAALHRIGFSGESPELPGWVSEEAKDFLGKCLMKCPSERWTAEELLNHPFVASPKLRQWVSPRCTLDRDFWESVSEEGEDNEEEDIGCERAALAGDRIRGLASRSSVPDWTWDAGWITIRELADSRTIITCDNQIIGEAGTSNNSVEERLIGSLIASFDDSFVSVVDDDDDDEEDCVISVGSEERDSMEKDGDFSSNGNFDSIINEREEILIQLFSYGLTADYSLIILIIQH